MMVEHLSVGRPNAGQSRAASIAIFATAASLLALGATPASASSLFSFSTGTVTNQIATASRPGPSSGPNQETESADDFILSASTQITSATFTGLIPSSMSMGSISHVVAEIYRVFPNDSNTTRTPNVPTRNNSPSDVALLSRDSAVSGELSYAAAVLSPSFTATNSVDFGINPLPNQTTRGEGLATGQEVQISVTFTSPFTLAAGHYFFVPQVEISDADQHFLWLSASRPIDGTGTPFLPDLQSWVRNDQLDPDWLRIGTDVVGGTMFNAAFTLNGTISPVPLPSTLALFGTGLLCLGLLGRGMRRQPTPT